MTKTLSYAKERKEILLELFDIMGINQDNNKFVPSQIENDEEVIARINEIAPKIREYFSASGWNFYTRKNTLKSPYISLIKQVLKDMNYTITTKHTTRKNSDGKYVKHVIYLVQKDSIDI
mgnify:CR=1 FL=1